MPKWVRAGSTAAAVAVPDRVRREFRATDRSGVHRLRGCPGRLRRRSEEPSVRSWNSSARPAGSRSPHVTATPPNWRPRCSRRATAPGRCVFPGRRGAASRVRSRTADPLPKGTLKKVPATYRAADGDWIGASGRARSLSTTRIWCNPTTSRTPSPNSPTPAGRTGGDRPDQRVLPEFCHRHAGHPGRSSHAGMARRSGRQ